MHTCRALEVANTAALWLGGSREVDSDEGDTWQNTHEQSIRLLETVLKDAVLRSLWEAPDAEGLHPETVLVQCFRVRAGGNTRCHALTVPFAMCSCGVLGTQP